MKAHPLYWVALVLALVVGASAQAQPVQVPMQKLPPHIKMCLAQMQTAQQMFMYRAAELTRDQVHSSISMAMQLLRWQAKQGGGEAPRDLNELETTYHAMADEIYDMSPENFVSAPHQQAWSSNQMNACVDMLKPKDTDTPSEDDQNLDMIPNSGEKPG